MLASGWFGYREKATARSPPCADPRRLTERGEPLSRAKHPGPSPGSMIGSKTRGTRTRPRRRERQTFRRSASFRLDATRAARSAGCQRPRFLCRVPQTARGVRMPRAPQGRTPLQSLRDEVEVSSASSSDSKRRAYRRSFRSRPSNDAMCASSIGFPGRLKSNLACSRLAGALGARGAKSVPLSTSITDGFLRDLDSRLSTPIAPCTEKDPQASGESASRVYWSTTVGARGLRSSCGWSCVKPMLRRSPRPVGADDGPRVTTAFLRCGRIRPRFGPSMRYSRSVHAWLTGLPPRRRSV